MKTLTKAFIESTRADEYKNPYPQYRKNEANNLAEVYLPLKSQTDGEYSHRVKK